jgi:hypothetical protein
MGSLVAITIIAGIFAPTVRDQRVDVVTVPETVIGVLRPGFETPG